MKSKTNNKLNIRDSKTNNPVKSGTWSAGIENGFNELMKGFLPMDFKKDPQIKGSSIPFGSYMTGDWALNPSSVSVSTFQKMAYSDSIISSNLEYIVAVVITSIQLYKNKNPQIQSFVRTALRKLDGGIRGLVREMCTAHWAGYYVGEKAYAYDNGSIIIDRVVSLPPSTIMFAVDAEGRVKDDGIKQYVMNSWWPSSMNSYGMGPIIGDPFNGNVGIDSFADAGDLDFAQRTFAINPIGLVSIPKKKCIHYTNNGIDGFNGPYGRSLLRSLYSPWVVKCGIIQNMLVAADRKGSPLLIVYSDPQQTIHLDDNTVLDSLSSAQIAFANYKSNGVVILPGMQGSIYDVKTVDVTANLSEYREIINYCDSQYDRGFNQPATAMGGEGSYSLGYSQGINQSKVMRARIERVCDNLIEQLVKDLINLNFTSYEHNFDYGEFDIQELSLDDRIKLAKLFETGYKTMLLNPEYIPDANLFRDYLGASQITEAERKKWNFQEEQKMTKKDQTNFKSAKDASEQPYAHAGAA